MAIKTNQDDQSSIPSVAQPFQGLTYDDTRVSDAEAKHL
jgi:hypothetical protein